MQQRQNATEPISRSAIELYHRYAPTIFTYICRHDISREDAEDLTVEVGIWQGFVRGTAI